LSPTRTAVEVRVRETWTPTTRTFAVTVDESAAVELAVRSATSEARTSVLARRWGRARGGLEPARPIIRFAS
jgi:hypothetical protein